MNQALLKRGTIPGENWSRSGSKFSDWGHDRTCSWSLARDWVGNGSASRSKTKYESTHWSMHRGFSQSWSAHHIY